MLGASTSIAEPDTSTGEVAWISAGTYALGDLRTRSTTHRVYSCVQAHTGRTALPEVDTAYWLDKSPTNRYAPFDNYTSTAGIATTTLTYVVTPGYFNALALFGLAGNQYSVVVKDVTGGTPIYSTSGYLENDPIDWYEYLFSPPVTTNKLVFTNIPIRPAAELTLTITNGAGNPVALGMLVCGDYRSLSGYASESTGGPGYGSSSEPVTYSYIKYNDDGTTTIVKRHSGTNLRASVFVPIEHASGVLSTLQEVLDVPVAWIGSEEALYNGLSTFGIGSGSLVYETPLNARLDITVKGLI